MSVCSILALLFVAVPAIELMVIIEVGSRIGSPATLGIILVTGVLGAALARHQGLGALRTLRKAALMGKDVDVALIEAVLVLCAAVLMMTPGFVTDAVGLALLVPMARRPVATALARRLAARMSRMTVHPAGTPWDEPGFDQDDKDNQRPTKIIDI